MPLNCSLNVVEMVDSLLGIFYYNLKKMFKHICLIPAFPVMTVHGEDRREINRETDTQLCTAGGSDRPLSSGPMGQVLLNTETTTMLFPSQKQS